ncbi:epoxide hydrolase [Kordiimonas sediminis]|uniref:Epoxide hydrolase n=1 Tax=Kordiimonas sediminis TaxID=1735581 RepID=A0A919AU72_9PROT|nr:alpha/beta hydrolase [Kordiimonas sediminis]GHF24011.1 epoxide hydrolase [Kordiimonas sediminis]
MTQWPTPQMVETKDFTLAVYEFGPKPGETDKPTLVFMHGFPELAYSWRYQAHYFAAEGYPVLVPDMPGYGKSSKPDNVSDYTMTKLTGAMADMIKAYGIDKAVFVGHDWGALVLWQMPFYVPEILLGCAGLNVPLLPHYPMDPVQMMRAGLGDDMYIVRFQKDDGSCEKILEKDPLHTMRFFLRKPGKNTKRVKNESQRKNSLNLLDMIEAGEQSWGGELLLGEEDVQVYVDAFKAGGYRAPIHWYRNMTANWQDQKRFVNEEGQLPTVEIPTLMITADMDRACPAHLADGMDALCTDYRRHDLSGCGHWSMQEQPDEVNKAIQSWLNDSV